MHVHHSRDRREKRTGHSQRVIWTREPETLFRYQRWIETPGGLIIDRRRDPDAVVVCRQLLDLAQRGVIDGIACVLLDRIGSHQLVVAGTSYDDPIHTAGVVSRLQGLLLYYPDHPLESLA